VPQSDNPQTLNRYSYVANNPVKYVDPSGNLFWAAVGAFLVGALKGAAIGAVVGGVASAIQGQNFLQGALIGAAGGFVTGGVASIASGWGQGFFTAALGSAQAGQIASNIYVGALAGAAGGAAAGATSAALYGGDIGKAAGFGAWFGAASGALFAPLPDGLTPFEHGVGAIAKGANFLTGGAMKAWDLLKLGLNKITLGAFGLVYEGFQFVWQSVNNLAAFGFKKLTNAVLKETVDGVSRYDADLPSWMGAEAITLSRGTVIFDRAFRTDFAKLFAHELGHVFQAELLGPAYLPVYLGTTFAAAALSSFGLAARLTLGPTLTREQVVGFVRAVHPLEGWLVPRP
jgi:hypothetical protein